MPRIPVTDLIKTIPEPYRGQLPYPGTAADHEAFEKALPAAHAALIQSISGSKLVPVPHTTDLHPRRTTRRRHLRDPRNHRRDDHDLDADPDALTLTP